MSYSYACVCGSRLIKKFAEDKKTVVSQIRRFAEDLGGTPRPIRTPTYPLSTKSSAECPRAYRRRFGSN